LRRPAAALRCCATDQDTIAKAVLHVFEMTLKRFENQS
jgi:hypothetical protein